MAFTPNPTVLQDAIISLSQSHKLLEHRNRRKRYGALSAHERQARMLFPKEALEAARVSARREVKIPILDRVAKAVITTRSCTIPCENQGSSFFTLTWETVGFTVCVTPSVLEDNYISEADYMAQQMEDGLDAALTALETSAIANLENNKALTVDAGSTDIYAFSGTAYQVPAAQAPDFYLEVPEVLEYNEVYPRFSSVATITEKILRKTIMEFGPSNERDRSEELTTGDWDFNNSKLITNAAGTIKSTHYIFKEGHIGMTNWIDPDARRGERIHESKFWTRWQDPVMGFDWGVFYNGECADKSAEIAGLERTKDKQWEFTADFAFATAVDDPVYKFEVLKV